jgi:hypothetical protein
MTDEDKHGIKNHRCGFTVCRVPKGGYDAAEIYDRPVKYMTVTGIFQYVGIDVIRWRGGSCAGIRS